MSRDVWLETVPRNEYKDKLRQWADVVVSMNLQGAAGVVARPAGHLGMAIYLSKHDDVSNELGRC